MQKYCSEEFLDCFVKLGLKKGDVILVHNSLFSFGIPTDISLKDLSTKIYESLLKVIGTEGTIVVPTFNFDFCKGSHFDRQKSPSKMMGAFSEYVRLLPDSKRSKHPMQSVSAIGKLSNIITENDTKSSFDEGGSFDKLIQNDAKIVLLGTDYNAASIIHMVEEREQVPYRYWKNFTSEYIDNGKNELKEYKMYVRDLELDPILNMNGIEQGLVNSKMLNVEKIGGGNIKCFKAKDYISIAKKLISNNPFYFVSNHPDFLKNEN